VSEPANLKSNAAHSDAHNVAHPAGRPERFRLKLSLPGKDTKGEWLCRLEGAALAYQNYCATYGTPRVFKWDVDSDGKTYLQDQELNWLSYDSIYNCLYMSYKGNRVAWKIDGSRLVRVSDGAVLTWKEHQNWSSATDKFLMALPLSAEALTVELVPEPPTPMELILGKMIPVFEKRHAPLPFERNDTERYHYSTSPAPLTAVRRGEDDSGGSVRQKYETGKLAFFAAVNDEIPSEKTVPVYLLRRWSREEARSYFKLSLRTEEAGYAVDPLDKAPGPKFRAFDSAQVRPYLAQLYEHSAETPTPELRRYIYDFNAEAHDGWSKGIPIFRAITPKDGERALVGTIAGENAKAYAFEWLSKNGEAITNLVKGRSKDDAQRRTFANDLATLLQDIPVKQKYTSLGAGAHFGYGIGTAGVEAGSIWRVDDFGHVPMHEPFSDYSIEWITFGVATGADLGVSADVFALGTWFGDISQIEGACNGITMALQVAGGAAVTLTWDGSWRGANYTAHPIGITVVVAAGLEVGGGAFYNASATQFFNRRKDFPDM
jgi:hypothetical protein